jgi:hypothetical protein
MLAALHATTLLGVLILPAAPLPPPSVLPAEPPSVATTDDDLPASCRSLPAGLSHQHRLQEELRRRARLSVLLPQVTLRAQALLDPGPGAVAGYGLLVEALWPLDRAPELEVDLYRCRRPLADDRDDGGDADEASQERRDRRAGGTR